MTNPQLDIISLPTHSLKTIALMDVSIFPASFTITSPTIQISIPGHPDVTKPFTANSLNVFNSNTLGITCDWCDLTTLPDGVYKLKYSVYPAYKYYVEKTFVRVDNLQAKLDKAFLLLDFMQCDSKIKKEDKLFLDTIQTYIEGALAAGHNCVESIFHKLYDKANSLLNKSINHV